MASRRKGAVGSQLSGASPVWPRRSVVPATVSRSGAASGEAPSPSDPSAVSSRMSSGEEAPGTEVSTGVRRHTRDATGTRRHAVSGSSAATARPAASGRPMSSR